MAPAGRWRFQRRDRDPSRVYASRKERGLNLRMRKHMRGGGRFLRDAGLERRPDGYGGTGLFAARRLPGGFAVGCPAPLLLSERAAARTRFGRRLVRRSYEAPLPREVLFAVLAEARRNRASPFHAYARALPYPSPDAGSWREDDAARLLGGTPLLATVRAGDRSLRRLADAVARVDRRVDLADLAWARGAWRSRGFQAVGGGAGAATTMAPFLDFLNHDDGADVRIAGSGDGLRFSNAAPLAAGAEATITYGSDRSNGELLLAYGFAAHRNERDAVHLITGAADAVADAAVFADGAIPPALWRAFGTSAEEPSREATEKLALVLQEAFVTLKHQAPRPPPGDVDPRATYARHYRDGQRRILHAAMGTCIKLLT